MAAYLDVRPPGLDIPFRPGSPITVTLAFPAGQLAGRTFTSNLGAAALQVTEAGDDLIVEATAAQTAAATGPALWLLLEDVAGTDVAVMVGTWTPSDRPNGATATTLQVTVGAADVSVTVLPGGVTASALAAVQADVTAVEVDVAAVQAEVDAVEVDVATRATTAALTAHTTDRLEHVPRIELMEHQPAVIRWRQKLARARAGGLSVQLLIIGDSISEGYTVGRYRNRWIDALRRRFQGSRPGSLGMLPASANVFSSVLDADWPGGDNPWTYAGGVTGSTAHGLGFHAANVPAGGSATFTYFGDKASVVYARTPTGPTACAVTLDGVAQATFNANGAVLGGQQAQYGTHGQYGHHTLTVTPNSGTLVLEAAQWFDGDAPFFTSGSVILLDGTHAGFGALNWADVSNEWSALLTGTEVFDGSAIISVGSNDATLGRTPAQFQADLETIVARIDARLGVADMGYLFVMVPGTTTAFVAAARAAAAAVGLDRASVFDLGQLRPDRLFGDDLEDDGAHPNDAGHIWIAEALGQVLDPTPTTLSPVTPTQQVIDSSLPATFRSSWTEAWAALAGGIGGFDQSGGGTTVGERRHRIWLDPGTYRVTVTMQEDTGLGTVEVLLGRWAGNTPTLTSCGSKANAAGTPTLVTTRLGTSVTTDVAGWVPLVVRKTSATGAIRFVRLVIDKTA